MFRFPLFSAAILAATLAAAPARAVHASFVVVHGIPGRDVDSTEDPLLPVDIFIGGKYCLISGLTFGSISGPFDVPPGTYEVAVSLANPLAPCSNTPVVTNQFTINEGQFDAVVAALSTTGAPALELYKISTTPVGAGMQRFVAVHAANAPAVEVKVVSTGKSPEKAKFKLDPGAEKTAVVATESGFSVSASVGNTVIGPISVAFGDQGVALVVAVGSAASGSATLLSKIIPDVF
jgi:hypothetical protein